MSNRASCGRTVVVWMVASAATMGALAWLRADRALAAAPVSLEDALGRGSAVVATGCALWLWTVTTVTALEAVSGRVALPRMGCPSTLRALVLVGCGVAVASAAVAPGYAEDPPGTERSPHPGVVRGLALPERPLGGPRARVTRAPRPTPTVLVVAAGDCLWSLAEQTLPSDPSDRAVDARWRQIYAANRSVVGPDPDLVRPGQRLVVPGAGR